MTPYELLKWAVLNKAAELDSKPAPEVTAENLDQLWDELCETDMRYDAMSEVRGGTEETGLACEYSRHYESKAVAAQMPDGRWVGWTYWFGGGKHGEPEGIDWMPEAYFVNFTEETRVVKVFTKAAQS